MSGVPSITRVDDALAAFDAALDYLATTDPSTFSGSLRETLSAVAVRRNRLDGAVLRLVDAFDSGDEWRLDGAASGAAWMRAHLTMTPDAARTTVRTARRLRELPALGAALQTGEISQQHVTVVANAMGRTEARRATITEAESTFAEAARHVDPTALAKVVARWAHAVDPMGALEAEVALHAQRHLSVSRTFEGAVAINGLLPPESGALVLTAFEALGTEDYRAWRGACAGGSVDPTGTTTPGQRRADALVELSRRYLDSGDAPAVMGARPHIAVTVPLDTLGAPCGEPGHSPAELEGVGPLSAEGARRIGCDATVTGFGLDPTGMPVSYGRSERSVPSTLRRLLVQRDRGCRFPGCDRPPSWCQAHHLVHWSRGGPTDAANLALLCSHHHHCLHEGGFTVRGSADVELTFVRPDGSVLHPPRHRAPGPADPRSDAPTVDDTG